MLKKFFIRAVFFSILCCFSFAAIEVNKYNVYLNNKINNIDNIVIKNPYDKAVYIKASLFKLTSPIGQNLQRQEVYSIQDADVSITPKQFKIAAKGEKNIQVSLVRPLQDEPGFYQLELMPLSSVPLVDSLHKNSSDGSFRLTTSHIINVHARPSSLSAETMVAKTKTGVIITNNGNVVISFMNARICNNRNGCKDMPAAKPFKLYPHETIKLASTDMDNKIIFDKIWFDIYGNKISTKFSA